eukprot:PhF_6_TR931/c0_g1_i1/m.1633
MVSKKSNTNPRVNKRKAQFRSTWMPPNKPSRRNAKQKPKEQSVFESNFKMRRKCSPVCFQTLHRKALAAAMVVTFQMGEGVRPQRRHQRTSSQSQAGVLSFYFQWCVRRVQHRELHLSM